MSSDISCQLTDLRFLNKRRLCCEIVTKHDTATNKQGCLQITLSAKSALMFKMPIDKEVNSLFENDDSYVPVDVEEAVARHRSRIYVLEQP